MLTTLVATAAIIAQAGSGGPSLPSNDLGSLPHNTATVRDIADGVVNSAGTQVTVIVDQTAGLVSAIEAPVDPATLDPVPPVLDVTIAPPTLPPSRSAADPPSGAVGAAPTVGQPPTQDAGATAEAAAPAAVRGVVAGSRAPGDAWLEVPPSALPGSEDGTAPVHPGAAPAAVSTGLISAPSQPGEPTTALAVAALLVALAYAVWRYVNSILTLPPALSFSLLKPPD